ncbi:three-Cys-motif partner protein TcmP [Sulfurirhabdus autotrophica]|uniref:Three-Cys-motif partner protein n=1 Tax=Sulfurirhabdus autotrophica TaxID=1706046 RepID=A0A4R3XUR1_9PROT|nr:three-Cys-motif partner protein TcmP [Sulfurirhabdus autotrophica]TCV79207.1 three-Cys-motif partner protein [Sulfurirhabdus autotrophica]
MIGNGKGGAVYFDLFCGTGRSRIRNGNEWIDGGAVAAWKTSKEGDAPFTDIYISDLDEEKLNVCAERLRKLGAPVHPIHASAVDAVNKMVSAVSGYGLHFAFVDPYSLEALDFRIISTLSTLKRIDLLIHFSAMDLQRNLAVNLTAADSAFDAIAPGWRENVNTTASKEEIRRRFVEFWRAKVTSLGVWPSIDQKLITGEKNQPLYWLLLAARHGLAHKFWTTASNPEGQGALF